MKKYDTLLFDWDGNLGQTLEAWLSAIRSTYVTWDMAPPTDAEIAKGFGNWQWPVKYGLLEAELPQFNEVIVESVVTKLEKVELYPGVREALDIVATQGIRRALISSSTKNVLRQALTHNGLNDYFEIVVSAEDVTHHKPDPECVELALQTMGIDKSLGRIAVVGDSDKDLGVAKATGLDCLLFAPEAHRAFYDLDDLKAMNPAAIFTEWSQFPELIR